MTLLFLLLLLAVLVALEVYSKHHYGEGLFLRARFDTALAEPDEPFHLLLEAENTRRLPVLFARLRVPLPPAMAVKKGSLRLKEQRLLDTVTARTAERTVFLLPRERRTESCTVSLPARGRYIISSLSLTAGDFMGLREETVSFSAMEEVVVLPKRTDSPSLDSALGNFLGERSVRRFILPDPVLTVGFHEYTGREPMKDIAWKRTLRDGQLMVKEYDYTAEPGVAVILNIDGADTETAEQCFSLTRGVCEWLEKRRVRYSFITNASTGSRTGLWSYLEDGLGRQHLYTVLEGLGRAPLPSLRCPALRLFDEAARKNDRHKGFVVITPPLASSGEAALRAAEAKAGQPSLVLSAGKEGLCC